MRRLSVIDLNALRFLDRRDSPYCPGTDPGAAADIVAILNGLVRRKLVDVDASDDGPVFTINSRGRAEARK